MFEVKLAADEIGGLDLPPDPTYAVRNAHEGRQTILATASVAQRDRWLAVLEAAGVRPIVVTKYDADPNQPSPVLVAELAEQWSETAMLIDAEICVGWDSMEPTRFIRAVSTYLGKHDPIKAQIFDKKYFGHLD